MDLDLTGQSALVTASTGGIGRAIAASLAREGALVYVNGRTEKSVQGAIDSIRNDIPSARLEPLVADNGTAAGAATTIEVLPELDILVNNLGIYEAVPFADATDHDWARLWEVNVMSAVRLTRHYLPRMIENNSGRIALLASEAAVMPSPEMAHYSATKAAVLSLSRSLAEMTKGSAVTVNAVVAGSTKTEGVREFVGNLYPELSFDHAESEFMGPSGNRYTSLIQRLIEPSEVADFIAFLMSRRASAINGAALRVDGGLIRSMV